MPTDESTWSQVLYILGGVGVCERTDGKALKASRKGFVVNPILFYNGHHRHRPLLEEHHQLRTLHLLAAPDPGYPVPGSAN